MNHVITDKNLARGGPIEWNTDPVYAFGTMQTTVKPAGEIRYRARREEKKKKKPLKRGWFG